MMPRLLDRLRRLAPPWRTIYERPDTLVRAKMFAGAAAGLVTAAGVHRGDKLVAVFYHQASAALQDLTAEFIGVALDMKTQKKGNGAIINNNDQLDNTGGTSTAAGTILVIWEDYSANSPM